MNIPVNTWVKIQKLTIAGPITVPRLVVSQLGPKEYLIDDGVLPQESLRAIHFDQILQIMPQGWQPGL